MPPEIDLVLPGDGFLVEQKARMRLERGDRLAAAREPIFRIDALVDDVGEYTSLSREELLDFFRQNVQHDYKEIEKIGRITDSEAIKRMVELCGCNNVLEIAGWEKEKRNRAIKEGLQAGISIRQFSRITGTSKAVIEKTIKTTLKE